jgi:uncharacterized protein (DUF2344 family)
MQHKIEVNMDNLKTILESLLVRAQHVINVIRYEGEEKDLQRALNRLEAVIDKSWNFLSKLPPSEEDVIIEEHLQQFQQIVNEIENIELSQEEAKILEFRLKDKEKSDD